MSKAGEVKMKKLFILLALVASLVTVAFTLTGTASAAFQGGGGGYVQGACYSGQEGQYGGAPWGSFDSLTGDYFGSGGRSSNLVRCTQFIQYSSNYQTAVISWYWTDWCFYYSPTGVYGPQWQVRC